MDTVQGARSGTALGDGWVRSACTICMNRCGILAHVNEDEVVDNILGDPGNPHNRGRTCAKGDAGFEGLTDADRITTPLRRTNPERGVGVDPGWVPITWDEALDEIAERLRETIADDPEKILHTSFDIHYLERLTPFAYQHLSSGDAPHSVYGAKPVVASCRGWCGARRARSPTPCTGPSRWCPPRSRGRRRASPTWTPCRSIWSWPAAAGG